jgi:hypothetical protein
MKQLKRNIGAPMTLCVSPAYGPAMRTGKPVKRGWLRVTSEWTNLPMSVVAAGAAACWPGNTVVFGPWAMTLLFLGWVLVSDERARRLTVILLAFTRPQDGPRDVPGPERESWDPYRDEDSDEHREGAA